MAVTIKQTTKPDTTLRPTLAEALEMHVAQYNTLKFDAELLEHQMDIEKLAIQSILEEAGLEKVQVDEASVSLVRGTTSVLDKMKFVELGGSLEQLENATVKKPRKPYVRIDSKEDRT